MTREQQYMPQMDAVRAFAVLGVLVAHNWRPLPWLLGQLDWGSLGVRLFFVLSGFLITGILLRCRDLADTTGQSILYYVRQFYARRFLRILPLYYFVLVIVLFLDVFPARDIWPWLVSFSSNIYIAMQGRWIGRIGHFWTLAVEEQFYLVWPWLVLYAARKRLKWIVLAAIAIAPIYRLYCVYTFPLDYYSGLFTKGTFTLACLDSLGMGALLALISRQEPGTHIFHRYFNRLVLPVGIVSAVTLRLLMHYDINSTAYFVFGDLSVAMIFYRLVAGARDGYGGITGRVLKLKPLVYLGKISYGVYIYHNLVPPLLVWTFAKIGLGHLGAGFEGFLLSSLVTVAIASLSWHWMERPINDLKRYFDYTAPVVAFEAAAPSALQLQKQLPPR